MQRCKRTGMTASVCNCFDCQSDRMMTRIAEMQNKEFWIKYYPDLPWDQRP